MTPKTDPHLWAGDWKPAVDPPTAGHHREPGPPRAAPPPPPAPRRRRGARTAAAGLVAVAVAAGAYGLGAAGGDDPAPRTEARTQPRQDRQPLGASTQRAGGDTDVGAVFEKASPAVVSIRTGGGQGTGFLIDDQGTIVTNAHVVGDSGEVAVRFGEDGERATGRVVGSDPSSDLAVVKVPVAATSGVTPLELADDSTVRVGDEVVAIGNPFGLDRTATAGIVSAVGRSIEAPNGFSIADAIQTDAPINPGNSGGPLLDGQGRVIGVTSQIATAGAGGNVGVGFAVPTSLVREIVPQLQAGRSVQRPYLGVSTAEPRSGAGATVAQVVPGGPADDAGLQPGDVIVRVGGQAVAGPEDVSGALTALEPGDRVEVTVRRGGSEETLTVTLGTRPEETP